MGRAEEKAMASWVCLVEAMEVTPGRRLPHPERSTTSAKKLKTDGIESDCFMMDSYLEDSIRRFISSIARSISSVETSCFTF